MELAQFPPALRARLVRFAQLVEQGAKRMSAGDYLSCKSYYREAAQLCPEAWLGLATAALGAGNKAEALEKATEAVEYARTDLTRAAALNCVGNILTRMNRRGEALQFFKQSYQLAPRRPDAPANIGTVLKWSGQLDAAINWFTRALNVEPRCTPAAFGRSLAYLLKGDLIRGFQEYENRWRNPLANCRKLDLGCPEWHGQNLNGKTICLYSEQGAGDTIQMLRYFPLVKARGGKIIFASAQGLRRLVEPLGWCEAIVEEEHLIPRCDYSLPIMSLPRVFATTLDTIPPAPYLPCPRPAPRAPRPLKIGLAWAGSPDHVDDKLRSIPLSEFAPLFAPSRLSRASYLSLQVGPGRMDLLTEDFPIADVGAVLSDFYDTAARMAELDLLITVDTSVAHIAGALGVRTWLLLPFAPDWRWMLTRSDSPWYPSITLYRQTVEGDWSAVMARVAADLDQVMTDQPSFSATNSLPRQCPPVFAASP